MSPATVARARRWRRTLAVLAVLALVATACGDDDSGDAAPEEGEETTTSAEATDDTTSDTTGDATGSDEMDLGEFAPIEGVPGVSDEEIHYALLSTGEANPLGYCLLACYASGVEAYFAYVNSLGGVNGRELTVDVIDDELGNGQVRALEITEGDYFGVFYNALQFPGMETFGESGMPTYTNAVPAGESDGKQNVFQMVGTFCIDCPSVLSVWQAVLGEGTKVATVGLSVAPSSVAAAEGEKAAIDRWGADAGIEHVYLNTDLPFGLAAGVAPEVTTMKDLGVDFFSGKIDQNSSVTFAQEFERQGMGDIHQLLPQGYLNTEFVAANADLFEGDLLLVPFRPFEADLLPSQELFLEWMDETGEDVTEHAMQGWLNAMLAVDGLVAAGPEFDQQSVVDATNTFEDYTHDGLTAPVDFGRQHDAPTLEDPVTNAPDPYCYSFVRVTDGAFELIGEPDAPWWCWPQDVQAGEWQEPVSTNFE